MPSGAQQEFLREGIELSNLRFIGYEADDVSVSSLLSPDDTALLVATDEPRTLNYLISGRLPVRASRLQELMELGLLRQEGMGFQSQVPIIRGEKAQALSDLLNSIAPEIAAESQVPMQALSDRLWRHPGVPTLPSVVAWMLRDRVWAHLVGTNGLDFERSVAEQQATAPNRGFWGALWYIEQPTPPAFDFHEWRRERYTIQIAWNHGDGDPFFSRAAGPVPIPEMLARLDNSGRRLSRREEFPGVLSVGLVDAEGDMRVLARDYDLDDDDGLAYLIEETAVAITEAILRRLPVTNLANLLEVAPALAGVIAYTELAPMLVTHLSGAGLLVRPDDDRADWRAAISDTDRGDLPQRASVVTDGDGLAVDVAYSAIIWRDLPVRPRLRIVWW
jgi:hypothetical protein